MLVQFELILFFLFITIYSTNPGINRVNELVGQAGMSQQRINISDLNKNWPTFINKILEGDEIILTKTDKPIAVVSPVKPEKISLQTLFPARKKSEEGEEALETCSEWWIG